MHWLGPRILPLAILTVVGVLAVALATIEALGRRALNRQQQQHHQRLQLHERVGLGLGLVVMEDVDVDCGAKMGGERQSRAPTAAGGQDEEAAIHPRVSFVTDTGKALDGSVSGGAGSALKSYHHRLSLSGGTGGFTTLAFTASSAAFLEAGKAPAKWGAVSGGGEQQGGSAVTVHTTYGT